MPVIKLGESLLGCLHHCVSYTIDSYVAADALSSACACESSEADGRIMSSTDEVFHCSDDDKSYCVDSTDD